MEDALHLIEFCSCTGAELAVGVAAGDAEEGGWRLVVFGEALGAGEGLFADQAGGVAGEADTGGVEVEAGAAFRAGAAVRVLVAVREEEAVAGEQLVAAEAPHAGDHGDRVAQAARAAAVRAGNAPLVQIVVEVPVDALLAPVQVRAVAGRVETRLARLLVPERPGNARAARHVEVRQPRIREHPRQQSEHQNENESRRDGRERHEERPEQKNLKDATGLVRDSGDSDQRGLQRQAAR